MYIAEKYKMSDLAESDSKDSRSPIFIEITDTNAQFPSPIQEPEATKADESSSALAPLQIMPQFGHKANTQGHVAVQTDLSFPLYLPDDMQRLLNAYSVIPEPRDVDSPYNKDVQFDSSGSEYLLPNLPFNYDLPSPPLNEEEMKILYESLSSSEQLDGELFQNALQDYRILSPPLSDIEGQLISPEDLEVLEINSSKKETENP